VETTPGRRGPGQAELTSGESQEAVSLLRRSGRKDGLQQTVRLDRRRSRRLIIRTDSPPARFGPTTPTRAGRVADASVDYTEARNDIVGCFGRSDRSAQRRWLRLRRLGRPPRRESPWISPIPAGVALRRSDGDLGAMAIRSGSFRSSRYFRRCPGFSFSSQFSVISWILLANSDQATSRTNGEVRVAARRTPPNQSEIR
jgi:hypothetical protein